jgi:hypothetical protein
MINACKKASVLFSHKPHPKNNGMGLPGRQQQFPCLEPGDQGILISECISRKEAINVAKKTMKQKMQAMSSEASNAQDSKSATRHQTQNEAKFNLPNQPST